MFAHFAFENIKFVTPYPTGVFRGLHSCEYEVEGILKSVLTAIGSLLTIERLEDKYREADETQITKHKEYSNSVVDE